MVCPEVRGSSPVRASIRASVARLVAHQALSAALRSQTLLQHLQGVLVQFTGVGEDEAYPFGFQHGVLLLK